MTRARLWGVYAATAAGAGLLVASTMTALDWRLNPGGVFQGSGGPRWDAIWQTWISWFLPMVAALLLLGLPIAVWISMRRGAAVDN